MVWSTAVPISATYIINIPSTFTTNYGQMEDWYGVQHYTYSSSLSGRHKPGITPFLYVNSTGNITGLTNPGSGALAFDITLGVLKRYDGVASAWKQVNLDPISCVDVYLTSDQTVASAAVGTYTTITFDSETTDVLNNWNSSTYKFTAPIAGYYMALGQATITPTDAGIGFGYALAQYSSADVLQNVIVNYYFSWACGIMCARLAVIWSLAATDWIACGLYHDNSTSQIVEGGSDYTWLKIYKVS